jgi:cell division septum initiation protein DivIVA
MITQEQVVFYQEQGYLLVENLLTQREAQELRQECHALAQRLSVHADMDATWGSARKAVAQAQHQQRSAHHAAGADARSYRLTHTAGPSISRAGDDAARR